MTDYKNELIQILDRVFTAGRLAGKEAVPADVWDREIGMNLEAIEALLSQHSKKRELEARVDENRIFMARLGRYTETSGVKVEVFDHIDQLTNGEGKE